MVVLMVLLWGSGAVRRAIARPARRERWVDEKSLVENLTVRGAMVHGEVKRNGTKVKLGSYDSGDALKGQLTKFWTYNCQHLQWGKLEEWGKLFGGDSFVSMQGTMRTYDAAKRERSLQQLRVGTHDIWEARVSKKKLGAQPEGVMVMAPKGMSSLAKGAYAPSEKGLEGRGLAVRFAQGQYDVMVMSLYCHVGSKEAAKIRMTEKLWNWARMVKSKLPGRTQLIIGVDANGHVGSTRRATRAVGGRYEEEEEWGRREGDEYPYIGAEGAEEENKNGELMREFLEFADMVAVNTTNAATAGWTWSSADGEVRTRVDYVLVDRKLYERGGEVQRSGALHAQLRASVEKQVHDHVPVAWGCQLRSWVNRRGNEKGTRVDPAREIGRAHV